MLQSLQLLLLRVCIILEEADGRSITSQAMLQQLNMLRKEMHRDYYVLDSFRGNQAREDEAKGHNNMSHYFTLSKFSPAKRLFLSATSVAGTGGTCTPCVSVKEVQQVSKNLGTISFHMSEFLSFFKNYHPRYCQPYFMHLMIGLSLFGRQMEMERVMNFLMQTEPSTGESTGVLPITGPAGVGKSTLVAHVYNSEKAVIKQFSTTGYERSDSVVIDEVELQRHQQLQKLYTSTRSGRDFQKDIVRAAEGWVSIGNKHIEVGEDMAELSLSDLPNNYVYDLGFQPALERANHPYPSIIQENKATYRESSLSIQSVNCHLEEGQLANQPVEKNHLEKGQLAKHEKKQINSRGWAGGSGGKLSRLGGRLWAAAGRRFLEQCTALCPERATGEALDGVPALSGKVVPGQASDALTPEAYREFPRSAWWREVGRPVVAAAWWQGETRTESVDERLQRLQLLLLRVRVILEEADGRSVTNQAMLQQLNILRKEMYRGYYVLDSFRGNQDKAKGSNHNNFHEVRMHEILSGNMELLIVSFNSSQEKNLIFGTHFDFQIQAETDQVPPAELRAHYKLA
ncbi:uncharacterized protein [Miscanthus floridulus]|uniref:uncharacterized protein n=1 Tax=Miscanthus floridulus TaxID=154761 RepID=UPI003458C8EF